MFPCAWTLKSPHSINRQSSSMYSPIFPSMFSSKDYWTSCAGDSHLNVKIRISIYLNIIFISVFQSFFDYYGGCMSYILQLFPLFVFHMYDNLTPAELSGQISNVSQDIWRLTMKITNIFRTHSTSSTSSIVLQDWQIWQWILQSSEDISWGFIVNTFVTFVCMYML